MLEVNKPGVYMISVLLLLKTVGGFRHVLKFPPLPSLLLSSFDKMYCHKAFARYLKSIIKYDFKIYNIIKSILLFLCYSVFLICNTLIIMHVVNLTPI